MTNPASTNQQVSTDFQHNWSLTA